MVKVKRPLISVVSSAPPETVKANGHPRDDEVSNAGLVVGLKNRETAAARLLHERFGARINRLVWRLLGADHSHQDVVHQAYLNVLSSIGKLRDPGVLGSWIAGVVVNTVRRELRARSYQRIFKPTEPTALDLPEKVAPDARLIAERFYAVLHEMSSNERIVFALNGLEGYTLPEIAAMTGCSLSTVKRQLKRARAIFAVAARDDFVLAAQDGEDHDD